MFHPTRHLLRILTLAGLVVLAVGGGATPAQASAPGVATVDASVQDLLGWVGLTVVPESSAIPRVRALASCNLTSCMLQCEAEGQACMAECDLLPIGAGRVRCRLACQREAAVCQDYCFAFCIYTRRPK